MHHIFEIKLKPKKIDLQQDLDKINKLNWHLNHGKLVKNGLEYVLDFSNFKMKCLVSSLFPFYFEVVDVKRRLKK